MTNEKILFHGSNIKIKGCLIPQQAKDLSKNPDNEKKAIYATSERNIAIAMAIVRSKGVGSSSLDMKKTPYCAVIYRGRPLQEKVYLYELDAKDFQKCKAETQFISEKKVRILRREELNTKDHSHLFRFATQKEIKDWKTKYDL